MSTETMTSRERVTRTVRGEPTDRMPIDLGVHFSTGISGFAYWNLREYLGLPTDRIEMADMSQLLARVDDDVLERFHSDTMLLNPPWPNPHRWNIRGRYSFLIPEKAQPALQKDGSWTIDADGKTSRLLPGGFFMEGSCPDFYGLSSPDKIRLFAARAERLFKETDKYTMFMGFSAFFDGLDFACDMITDPETCREKNQARLERQIAYFDQVNAAMGKYINCIEVNSDLGTQDGLMCRPDDYRELCAPFLKQFCSHVRSTSDIQIFLHCCGSVSSLIPDIIACGVDILNPVQISARNMDPQYLKSAFGDKITFWGGGCDTQKVLNFGTPEQVRAHVRHNVETFRPNGRYVFNQVHNIMGDVRPENIVAMFDTAYENSFSPAE